MGDFGRHIRDYEIQGKLGQGGFAVVERAICKNTGKEVAIKVIDKNAMAVREMLKRAEEEIRIHSQLKHPSILELYTCFQDDRYLYLVLELCQNGELQRYVKNKYLTAISTQPVVSELDTAHIMLQVLNGLKYLDSHKIIHRDLSLTNLLLTGDMHVKIADFGLATQLTAQNQTCTTMCGTPNFISPEVATNKPYGPETDIWGLGVLMYTLLVGRPPFDKDDGVGPTFNRIAHSQVQIPDHLCLSLEARDLLERLLSKNPNARPKLDDILNHDFIRKNTSPAFSSFAPSSRKYDSMSSSRWIGYDSGLASSYLTSGHSYPPISDTPVISQHVPILNGAYRKQQQQQAPIIPQHPQEISNSNVTCCNGHFPSNPRGTDCSHCNPSTSHGHICHGAQGHQHLPSTSIHTRPKIPIPPIVSHRLLPVRQKTKNVIVNIVDNGEVCLEFLKTKDGHERVTEVLRISPDGLKIVLYQPHRGKGVPVSTSPPPLPSHGADQVFTYENIPEKHWKKYSYAAKFVDLVKSKTPKVTFYSKSAKCFLMENGPDPDFESCFYEGGKITKSGSQVKIIESNGKSITFDHETSPTLSPNAQLLWEHFEKCLKHCQKLEATMEALRKDSEDSCFPMIVGRRPQQYQKGLQTGNKENVSPQQPSIVNVRTIGGYEASVVSTSSRGGTSTSKSRKVIKELGLPGIGHAAQYSNGDISVVYSNGSKLVINPTSPAVSYVYPTGQMQQFKENDIIPSEVKTKLSQMETVISALSTR